MYVYNYSYFHAYITIYVHSTINISHIDALLYDAPCKNEGKPANNAYQDFVYNWNATRIFRPLMEHKECYVSIFV